MDNNYKALSKLIPDLLEILTLQKRDCYYSLREYGFYDLNMEVLSKRGNKYRIALGYSYILNGDIVRSPEFEMDVDLSKCTCEAVYYVDHQAGYHNEKIGDAAIPENTYLGEWLESVYANHGAIFPIEEIRKQQGRTEILFGQRPGPNNHDQEDDYSEEERQLNFSNGMQETEVDKPDHPEEINTRFFLRSAIDNNMAVLETLAEVLETDRDLAQEERVLLGSFRGLGTLRNLVLSDDYPTQKTRFWELANRIGRVGGMDERSVKEEVERALTNMYFTPPVIAEAFVSSVIKNTSFTFEKVLEPALGTGNMVQHFLRHNIPVTGVEMNFITAQIARLLYPSLHVVHDRYENYTGDTLYDLVISNVPFSKTQVFAPSWVQDKQKMRFAHSLHGYYFAKSLDLLEKGGMMAFVAPTGIMDSADHRELREYLMSQADFITAVRLPDDTFENTQVTADLIILQKRPVNANITDETVSRNRLFVETENLSLSEPGTDQERIFKVSSWYLSPEGRQNVLGSWAIGRMHGGFNLAVKNNMPDGESLLGMSISDAVRRAAGRIRPKPASMQNHSDLEIDRTPANLLCQDNIRLFEKVREGLSFDDIVQGWEDANAQYQSLKPEEKEHYRILWNRSYNEKIKELSGERAVIKFAVLVHKGMGMPITAENERHFNRRMTELFADNFTAPGLFPKKLYTLSRMAQSDTDRGKVYPAVIFLNQVRGLFEILEQIHEEEERLIDMDRDTEVLVSLRQNLTHLFNALKQDITLNENDRLALINDYFKQKEYWDFSQLEQKDENGNIVLAEIFHSFQDRRGENHYSERDWLLKCLNKYGGVNKIYLDAHSQGGMTRLLDQGAVFRVPGTQKYELAEKYLSGDVKQKLVEARRAMAEGESDLGLNISELERIIPEDKSMQEIAEVVNLGERWIPIEYFNDFVRNHLNVKAQIYYDKFGDQYLFEEDSDGRIHNIIEGWKLCPYWNADKVLEKAFSHTYPFVTETKTVTVGGVSKKMEVPNEKATKKGAMLIEKIRTEWKSYCLSNLKFREFLLKEYNERFNNTVLPHFDGSALTFDDMVGLSPYPTQKNAVWRCLQSLDGDGIFDHYVGAGKSLVMSAAAHEMNRIGRTKRVLIIGLVANIKELYQKHIEMYPKDKVLYVDRKYSRAEMLAKIRNGSWNVVFMPHTQFNMIPHDKNIVVHEIQCQIDSIEETLSSEFLTKKQMKGLIARKHNLEAKLKIRTAQIKKDIGLPTFKDLGFDYLMVDESHIFKNLGFATKHQNLAGLGNAEGSQRALNMLYACRTLQQKWGRDTGVAFFSGTPISNSLTELYNLQRYISPSKLLKRGMYSLDSWLTTYGLITTEYEINVAGTIAPKERLRGVMKADQLVKDYWMMADVVQRTDQNVVNNAPKLDPELVKLSPTPVQEVFNDLFLAFTQIKDPEEAQWIAPLLFDDSEKFIDEAYLKAKMVVVASMAKQASIHMGLRRSDMVDFYSPKIEALTERVMKYYRETSSEKGTQIIFSNVGTPSSAGKEKGFNIYDLIRRRLVAEGIPEQEIVFIHDYDTDTKRDKLFERVNKGEYRIIIGSTEKLGTGVNIQERCVCMHHIDIPWRPDEVEQRNGRGARQGNWLAEKLYGGKVKAYFYATEKMLDVLQYNLLDIKQNTKDILHYPQAIGNVFKLDDRADDGTPTFDEYVADLSGDDDMLKKVKLEKQIEDISYRHHLFLDKKALLEGQLHKAEQKIQLTQENMAHLIKEKNYLVSQMDKNELENISDLKLENIFDLSNIGKGRIKVAGNDEIGAILLQELKDNRAIGEHIITNYLGFDLMAVREICTTDITQMEQVAHNRIQMRNPETGAVYLMSLEAQRTERTAGSWVKNTLKSIISRPNESEVRLGKEITERDSYKTQLDAYPESYQEAGKLPEMKEELAELERRILKNGGQSVKARLQNIEALKMRYAENPELFVEDMKALDAQSRQSPGIEINRKEMEILTKEKIPSQGIQASLF